MNLVIKRLWDGGRCFWFEEGSLRKQVYLFFALSWCFCHQWFFFFCPASPLDFSSLTVDLAVSGNKTLVEQSCVSTSTQGCFCKCFLSALSHLLVCTQNTLGNSCAQNPPPYNLLPACRDVQLKRVLCLDELNTRRWVQSCEFLTAMIMQEHLWAFLLLMDPSDVKQIMFIQVWISLFKPNSS